MSLVEPTLISLARAAAVSLATLVVLLAAGPGVQSWPRKMRAFTFWMGMVTLLAPGFAVAFLSYDNFVLRPGSLEVTYCVVVFGRYIPAALLVLWLFPPGMSDEALHCLRLADRRRRVREPLAWGRGLWVGCALVFLLVFQEFEITTTWNMRAWTTALFDAQAGGLALHESLRLALLPFVIQSVLIALHFFAKRPQVQPGSQRPSVGWRSSALFLPAMFGWALVAFHPALLIGKGMPYLLTTPAPLDFAPWREILNTLALTSTATLLAWLFAGRIEKRRGLSLLLALPGLFGPLLTGLTMAAALQFPPLYLLRDTALPTVLGLTLMLLPFALLLRFGIEAMRDNAAVHIARSTEARQPLWHLQGWPRLCALLLLFCFAYGDFTINSLLAPPQFTSASVRLLNLLHYGRSDALMVMFVLAFAVPLAVALVTVLIARFHPRRRAS